MKNNLIRRILLIVAIPPAVVMFWLSLFVTSKNNINTLWQQVERLKHDITRN